MKNTPIEDDIRMAELSQRFSTGNVVSKHEIKEINFKNSLTDNWHAFEPSIKSGFNSIN